MTPSSVTLRLDPKHVFVGLLVSIAALVLASTVAGSVLYYFGWAEETLGFAVVKLFWLDSEQNIPTIYQTSAMLFASVLFASIAQYYKQSGLANASAWNGLAIIMLFLGVDETAQIHEHLGAILDLSFGASWIFLYIPVGLIFLACLTPFLLKLPARLRLLLIVSGTTFVVGGVGVEIVGQLYAEKFGKWSAIYAGFATLEETLEMLGIALSIFALLDHLAQLEQSGPTSHALPLSRQGTTYLTHLCRNRSPEGQSVSPGIRCPSSKSDTY